MRCTLSKAGRTVNYSRYAAGGEDVNANSVVNSGVCWIDTMSRQKESCRHSHFNLLHIVDDMIDRTMQHI